MNYVNYEEIITNANQQKEWLLDLEEKLRDLRDSLNGAFQFLDAMNTLQSKLDNSVMTHISIGYLPEPLQKLLQEIFSFGYNHGSFAVSKRLLNEDLPKLEELLRVVS